MFFQVKENIVKPILCMNEVDNDASVNLRHNGNSSCHCVFEASYHKTCVNYMELWQNIQVLWLLTAGKYYTWNFMITEYTKVLSHLPPIMDKRNSSW